LRVVEIWFVTIWVHLRRSTHDSQLLTPPLNWLQENKGYTRIAKSRFEHFVALNETNRSALATPAL
jgi:hypothetical protein